MLDAQRMKITRCSGQLYVTSEERVAESLALAAVPQMAMNVPRGKGFGSQHFRVGFRDAPQAARTARRVRPERPGSKAWPCRSRD